MSDIIYSNIRDLNKRLDKVNTGLKRELATKAKEAVRPLQSAVVKAIPSTAPRRGMRTHRGRTSWDYSVNYKGQIVPAKSVTINYKSGGSRQAAVTSLVRVVVNSPAVAIADMAYQARSRRGEIFIRGLGGSPSRFIWPAAEKALPAVQAEVRIILNNYSKLASRSIF